MGKYGPDRYWVLWGCGRGASFAGGTRSAVTELGEAAEVSAVPAVPLPPDPSKVFTAPLVAFCSVPSFKRPY